MVCDVSNDQGRYMYIYHYHTKSVVYGSVQPISLKSSIQIFESSSQNLWYVTFPMTRVGTSIITMQNLWYMGV